MSFDIDHFNAMEKLGQITIFHLLENEQPVFVKGDKVHATITPEDDYEAYIYFEAYCPNVLKMPGKIVEILENNQYLISFAGCKQILKADEIQKMK